MAEMENPSGWQATPGSGKFVSINKNITPTWCFRQLVKFALPWIAAAVTAFCSPSGKAGRSLDRLLIFVEGGADEI
jgi:hypothetical protein